MFVFKFLLRLKVDSNDLDLHLGGGWLVSLVQCRNFFCLNFAKNFKIPFDDKNTHQKIDITRKIVFSLLALLEPPILWPRIVT